MNNSDYRMFSTDQIRKLINGKFTFYKCTNCDGKGWVWVDGIACVEVAFLDPNRDSDEYYQDVCYECEDSLGGKLVIED